MKENYNIKVSAEYEVPKNDKLDALMAEYYAAKNAYEETEQQIVPLINASGKAKFDAIIDQLEVVVDHMKQYALITGKSPIQYSVSYDNGSNCNKFTILYWQSDGQIKMYFNGYYDNLQKREFVWHNEYNANPISSNNHQALVEFLSEWNKYTIIKDLLHCVQYDIGVETQNLLNKAKKLHTTFNGIKGTEQNS